MQMIDILLKYILWYIWYEFLNDLDAQSDFDKLFVTKKTGQVESFLSLVCSSTFEDVTSPTLTMHTIIRHYLQHQKTKAIWTSSTHANNA